jgi:hypothetical protein
MLFFLIDGETAEFGAVQDNYTKEHRHATEALLRGFVADIVDGIAAARGLDPKQVRAHRREPSRFIDCISHTPAPGVSWLCLIFPCSGLRPNTGLVYKSLKQMFMAKLWMSLAMLW